MRKMILAAAAAFLSTSGFASAHEFTLGDLIIDHPMAYNTAATARSGGGYLTITNTGDTADRLIGVRANFPKVELHTTEEKDGVARMMHVDAIDLPPGATVALQPGGFHVMFMGLGGDPLEVGEEIPATLIFEQAGEIEVMFTIEERGAAGKTGHSSH